MNNLDMTNYISVSFPNSKPYFRVMRFHNTHKHTHTEKHTHSYTHSRTHAHTQNPQDSLPLRISKTKKT